MDFPDRNKLKIHRVGEQRGKKPEREYDIKTSGDEKAKLGEGIMSKAFPAVVSLKSDPTYRHMFALKRFKLGMMGHAEDKKRLEVVRFAALLVERYQGLKKAGVKHLPATYQFVGLDATEAAILVTDLTAGGKKAVLTNQTKEKILITEVVNFKGMLDEIGEEIKRASNAHYLLPADGYFFMVPKEGGVANMEFSIVDYDGVYHQPAREPVELMLDSATRAKEMIKHIIKTFVVDELNQGQYLKELEQWTLGAVNQQQ